MYMRPEPGWKAKVNGLRRPSAQVDRLAPVAAPRKGLSAGIDAEDLAQPVAQRLRVGGSGVLAHCDVELAVGAEVDGAAVVIGRARVVRHVPHERALPVFLSRKEL